MSLKAYDQRCTVCDWSGSILTEPTVCPPCPSCGGATERLWQTPAQVIDDTLPGGPRWIDNLGHDPVWVETKTQYRQELAKRGLVQHESDNYNRNDHSPWATATRLRAGVVGDAWLHDLAAKANAPRVPIVRVRDEQTITGRDRLVIEAMEQAIRSLGYLLAIRCDYCLEFVTGDNKRSAQTWRMSCACRMVTHGDAESRPAVEVTPARSGGSLAGGG